MPSKHDSTANQIAQKKRTRYNQGPGPDIKAQDQVIEIETAETIHDGLRQLRGFRKAVYIAGSDQKATQKALETTEGTTVGVMDPTGKVIKRSTRKRR